MSDRNYKVIDCFPYFDETGKELLRLRVEMLKDYVDYFIITESNKTQSGIPIDRNLRNRIKEYSLPEDKIIIIDLDIPEDDNLVVYEADYQNCLLIGDNEFKRSSLLARVRERMQKNAVLLEIYRFSDDDVFILSDSDEIIDPKIIDFYSKEVRNYPDYILKFPLVHLEGRADLRVFWKNTKEPVWDDSLFMCTKKHLLKATPAQIRFNINNPFILTNYYHDGVVCTDLGWHFQWMGGSDKRKIKASSFTHFDDNWNGLEKGKYSKAEDTLNTKPINGSPAFSRDIDCVLMKYPIENLPKEVFKFEDVVQFLFNEAEL